MRQGQARLEVERRLKRRHRFLVVPAKHPADPDEGLNSRVEWFYRRGLPKLDERVVKPAYGSEEKRGIPTASNRMVWVQPYGLTKLKDGFGPIPVDEAVDASERVACLTQCRIDLERLSCKGPSFGIGVCRWKCSVPPWDRVAFGQSRIRWRNAWVLLNRLFEVLLCPAKALRRPLVQMVTTSSTSAV